MQCNRCSALPSIYAPWKDLWAWNCTELWYGVKCSTIELVSNEEALDVASIFLHCMQTHDGKPRNLVWVRWLSENTFDISMVPTNCVNSQTNYFEVPVQWKMHGSVNECSVLFLFNCTLLSHNCTIPYSTKSCKARTVLLNSLNSNCSAEHMPHAVQYCARYLFI